MRARVVSAALSRARASFFSCVRTESHQCELTIAYLQAYCLTASAASTTLAQMPFPTRNCNLINDVEQCPQTQAHPIAVTASLKCWWLLNALRSSSFSASTFAATAYCSVAAATCCCNEYICSCSRALLTWVDRSTRSSSSWARRRRSSAAENTWAAGTASCACPICARNSVAVRSCSSKPD